MSHSESSDEQFSFDYGESEIELTRRERLQDFYEEFIRKPGMVAWNDRRTRIGSAILFVYVLMGTVGVWFYRAPQTNQVDVPGYPGGRGVPPFTDLSAILGSTQQSGKDILAQIIHATPNMLLMVLSGGVFATVVAVLIGTVAGYKGGTVDTVLTSFTDFAMSIPGLPLVMVLAVVLRPTNPLVLGIVLMVNYWAGLGRAIRSEVLSIRQESFVEASRTMGVSTPRILFKDVIPNIMPYVLVNFANAARFVIFSSVGLYYLGILPAGVANWGIQLDRAYSQGSLVGIAALYQLLFPMIMIMGLALSMILLAQGADRIFNPRVRTRLAGESETIEEEEDADAPAGVMT
ncbi:ABC transporter permease subunit [Halorhabdus amylolytica]|uniref:ABC transporter permease subunit n=1 Tax=Halorhabdus amylolytica TaxID=2559573 RepID=UPI0010A9E655